MNNKLTYNNILNFLTGDQAETEQLFMRSENVKSESIGRYTYLRGLIELSNICRKDCLYCGIRCSNKNTERYTLTDSEVIECAIKAYESNYGSIVIQAGENQSKEFILKIERLLKTIKKLTNNSLAITLSLGEQTHETLSRWRDAGAERYLLRIETSSEELFRKIHPDNELHSFDTRIKAIESLRELSYQLGSGVMIGLPFQTVQDLAHDLIWLRDMDIDMCGMGPYLEHKETPLYEFKDKLKSLEWRKTMTLKMIASLRILMPTINIAATTALQSIDPAAREKAMRIGANVVMPNLTPKSARSSYKLYENKPTDETKLFDMIENAGDKVCFGVSGTSKHYRSRINKSK